MKKTLAILLLLSLVVGCEGDTRNSSTDAVTNGVEPLHDSMKPCSFCKNTVSRYAVSCPHCGVPFYDQKFKELVIKIGGEHGSNSDGHIYFLDFAVGDELTDDHLIELNGIARAANRLSPDPALLAYVTDVSVVEQTITDAGLQHLVSMLHKQRIVGGLDENEVHSKTPRIYLQLAHTKITNDGLRVLRWNSIPLRRLKLVGTEFTDASIEHLKTISRLESIDLAGTKVTDAGVAELQKALPDCEITH